MGGRVEEDLCTPDVELRIRGRFVSLVQSEEFCSNKIIPSREFTWNIDREKAIVLDELLSAPFGSCRIVAFVPDFEPAGSSSHIVYGRSHGLHVNRTRPTVNGIKRSRLRSIRIFSEQKA
jgi:hypothetical protein